MYLFFYILNSCLIKIPGENATFVETADIADESEDSDGYMIPDFSRGATGPHFSRGATGSNQGISMLSSY
jgi:hypothetical protein